MKQSGFSRENQQISHFVLMCNDLLVKEIPAITPECCLSEVPHSHIILFKMGHLDGH